MVKKSDRGQFKGRNTGARKRNAIILIAAEGNNKTEENYFRQFPCKKYNIRFSKGNETDPKKMMGHLLEDCENMGIGQEAGDRAFCLVDNDVDVQKDCQIAKADEMARKSKKKAAQIVSNPCFEVWYLCHKKYSTKQYASSQEVIDALTELFGDYKKQDPNMCAKTIADIATACDNAKKLESFNLDAGRKPHTASFLPSTEVYKVIEAIRDAENSKSR